MDTPWKWVQRHISKFGGDPSKITIIGGSAGGGSVINQMIMYGGVDNPPFRAAIAGEFCFDLRLTFTYAKVEYPWMQPYHNSTTLQKQYDALREVSGCDNLDCLRQLATAELRNATAQTYLTAYEKGLYGYGDFYFGPYVDGSIIQDLPSNEFNLGHFSKVPLLTNREGYEGYFYDVMPKMLETR